MRKVISISLTIMVIFTIAITVLTTVSLSSQEVALTILPAPKIDIVLAKSKTNTNVTNFSGDLMNALGAQGIDTNLVNITSVEAQNVDISKDFSWQQDISPSIGSISITNNGKNVVMYGNTTNPGKNAIWIIPPENQEQEFNFSYNIDYGDSFNAAGMLLRVQQNGNTLKGYMLSFNNYDWQNSANSNLGAIWEFTYVIGQNSTNMTKTLRQGLNIQKSGDLHVKVTDSEIYVSGGGMSAPVTYKITNSFGNGYGFFSDHYSHSCDQIGSFSLTNINLQTTKVRTFSEVLREPSWRDNAIKVLINVSDVVNEELNSTAGQGELLTRLINEDINFVGWGNSANQAQFENLIHANNENGKFITNSNYSNSILETAKYVKTLVGRLENKSNYLLLNDDIKIASSPDGILNNTADEKYPYGKWKINHDFLYFENNVGQFANNRRYINNMITKFDKTGKYEITYEDKEISPQEIYVHRRPNAVIKTERSGNNIVLTSGSYDLDSYSTGNNGIKEEEWKYKKTTDADWTNGKLTSITADSDYVVQLKVKDYQNTYSKPVTIYQTGKNNALPIASFNIKNNEITKYENLEILDTSYDPYGGTITSHTWTVMKDGAKIYTGATPLTKYNQVGTYTMQLTVKNDRNLTSETYSRSFEIIEDTIAPEFVAVPELSDWKQSVTVNLKFSDLGGSKFKHYKYAITNSLDTPTEWSSNIAKAEDNIVINVEGRNYLHVVAEDNAGNISEDRVLGEYLVDRSNPVITVTGDFNTTTVDELSVDIKATDKWSGIAELNINGQSINNGNVKFVKNGTYTIYAEDKVGRSTTKVLEINNIYYKCNAGLEHPIYSSTFDSCPICEKIKNIEILKEEHIYNSEKQGVDYNNPDKAEIVEYYNNVAENPENAGKYEYDFRVVYKEKEYKTGIVGTYKITTKKISITDIVVLDKTYDGTKTVTVQGGRLEGVIEGDIVQFKLPYSGTINVKDVGTHDVALEEIILTQDDAPNYTLIQPAYGSLRVTITPKDLTIVGLSGKTKKYDRDATVEIVGGRLEGNIPGDDLKPIIPATGKAHSNMVGKWSVDIEDIIIKGIDAKNYTFIQPLAEDIKVEIVKPEEPIMKVTGNIEEINGKKTTEIKSQDVQYKDVVKLKIKVENVGKGDGYVSKVTVNLPAGIEFTKNNETNNKYDWREIKSGVIATTIYSYENDMKNEIKGTDSIKSTKPPVEEKLTKESENEKLDANMLEEVQAISEDTKDSKQNTEEETKKDTKAEEETKREYDYKELELIVNIIRKDKITSDLIANVELEQQDRLGDLIPYTEETKYEGITQLCMPYKYFDAGVIKQIDKITIKDVNTGDKETVELYQGKDEVIKVDLSSERIEKSIVILKYNITVVNDGNTEGTVQKVIDILPTGVDFNKDKNPNWEISKGDTIVYNNPIKLKVREKKTLELLVDWDLRESDIGAKDNQVSIEAEKDIDQIIATENHTNLEGTNNQSHAEILITIPTGSFTIICIIISLVVVIILITGVYFIKKKVV